MRKWTEEVSDKDRFFNFIKQKFDYYDIPYNEASVGDVNRKYWIIGSLFGVVIMLLILSLFVYMKTEG